MSHNGAMYWNFSQIQGSLFDDYTNKDIISCIEFNNTGELFAIGDKGGRLGIFQRISHPRGVIPYFGEYKLYTTFQSHESKFDYLHSVDIDTKINKICWLRQASPAQFLLTANDKMVKLWKVAERAKFFQGFNTKGNSGLKKDPQNITALKIPAVMQRMPVKVEASPRRIYQDAHSYIINSVSVNCDQETYLSSDDLRINLWNLEVSRKCFNIVDLKPPTIEELTLVITAVACHPTKCNLFVYSTSKAEIRLCDMRASALCDTKFKRFVEPPPMDGSFFDPILASIHDIKVSHSGRYMMARDYMNIKVWDFRMETKPIETYPVHDYLRPKLCSLYENECVFQKFSCCWNGTDTSILTGTYNNYFQIIDRTTRNAIMLEASRDLVKKSSYLSPLNISMGGKRKIDEINLNNVNLKNRILCSAWHPKENLIAVGTANNLFIFKGKA